MKKAKKKAAVVVAQDKDGLRLLQRNARIAKAAGTYMHAYKMWRARGHIAALAANDAARGALFAELERKP